MTKKSIKLYFLLGIILVMAISTPYILHGDILIVNKVISEKYVQFVVLFLVLLNLVMAYIFYYLYKRLYFLFGIVIIIAILTPHLLHGHILIPEEYAQKYAQSIVLLLDLALVYMFYFIFRRETKRISTDKKKAEENLLDSYKYIGKTNIQLNLFNKFINSFSSKQNKGVFKEKDIFTDLLVTMVNSVVKANKGLIRFINKDNKRTIKEFIYHNDGDQFVVKLSNREALDHKESSFNNHEVVVVQSDYVNTKIRCLFCYAKKQPEGDIDKNLLQTLLNQVHLLFLVTYSKSFNY